LPTFSTDRSLSNKTAYARHYSQEDMCIIGKEEDASVRIAENSDPSEFCRNLIASLKPNLQFYTRS